MRTNMILTTLLAVSFLALAAGSALAQAPQAERGAERAEAMREMHAARNESLQQFKENRTAAIAAYHASINATRASFLENKTAVIEDCREARNETADDNNSAFAQCVRDGLKPLIEKARGEHKAAREDLLDALLAARQAAKAHFANERAAIRERHAPPS